MQQCGRDDNFCHMTCPPFGNLGQSSTSYPQRLYGYAPAIRARWRFARAQWYARSRRPALVQGRHHLRAARQGLLRQQRRRHRRLSRADREARLPAGPGRHLHLAAAVLPVAAARRRLRHRRLPRRPPELRHARRLRGVRRRGAHARPAGHHRAGDEPHLGPAPLVPGGARRSRDSPYRDYYVWSDTDEQYPDARIIFTDTERSNWTWDHERRPVLLAPLLQPPARPELRQPRGPRAR